MDSESPSDATESLNSPRSEECTEQQTQQTVDEKVAENEASESAEPQRDTPTGDDGCTSVGELQPALETYFAAPTSSSDETQLQPREESSSSVTQQTPKSLDALEADAATTDDTQSNPSDAPEQVVEFGEGPLGLTMRRSREDIVVVHSIADDTQAASSDMIVGDRILQLGSYDLRGMRVDKESWRRAIEHVKSSPRPLLVVYQRRTVSQPSVQNLAPPSPLPVNPIEVVSAYARKRTFVAKRKLIWARFLKEIGTPSRGQSLVDAADSHLVFDGPVAVWRQPHRFRALLTLVKQGDYFQRDRFAFVFKRPTDNAAVFVVAAISNPKLVIATNKWRLPDTSLDVERCVALDACKLRRKPRVDVPTGTSVFEISTPDGDVTLAVESEEQKVAWLSVLATLLLSATRTAVSVEGTDGDYAEVSGIWRHHVLLGTPQSLAATTAAVALPAKSSIRNGDEIMGASDDAETIADAPSQLEEVLEDVLPGCSVNLRDADGRTALHIAAQRGAADAVRVLLEAGAERDVIDARGSTPLHEAARGWHDAAVSLLLATAANKKSEVDTFEECADFSGCGDSSREVDAIATMLEARDVDGTTAVVATAYRRDRKGAGTNDGHSKPTVHHEHNLERLSRTLLALSAWGAQLDARDGAGLCLLHRLALTQQAEELDVVCRSCGVDAKTRLLASPKPTEGDGKTVRVVERFLQRGATALHVAFAGEIAAAQIKHPISNDAASLPKTCDVLTRYGCSAYEADADGNTAIELAFAVLEHTGDYSPGLQAAVCALCISASESVDAESKPKQKHLVDIALAAAKQRGQRKSQQSSSFSTLVEALEAIKKDRKRKTGKSGLGGWFSNLTSSNSDESHCESRSSTASVTSGQSQPASKLPRGELQHEKKSPVPRNFASQAYQRSANDEKFRAELFSGSKQTTSMSSSEKIEGQASGFEDLKNELSQRGERLGKLSEKSEELANAAEEFERMCKQLNRKKQGNSGWW